MILPDYATRFDLLSLSACLLDLKGVGDTPRQASRFLWRYVGRVFLITNWHVFTGINMISGELLANGWCPEKFIMQYFTKPEPDTGLTCQNSTKIECPVAEIPLYEDFHSPFWIQHCMSFDWGVDIVALPIDRFLKRDYHVECVNDRNYPRLYQFAGSEIFVLGYPLPKQSSAYPIAFPIWKRGSIASEIIVPWNMRPAFLIDCRTSQGMSGSPVFSRVFGPAAFGDGTIKSDSILTSEFMGVYSGRLSDDDNNASIGMVWHRNLIDQIFDSPSPGSREWKPVSAPKIFSKFKITTSPLTSRDRPAARGRPPEARRRRRRASPARFPAHRRGRRA